MTLIYSTTLQILNIIFILGIPIVCQYNIYFVKNVDLPTLIKKVIPRYRDPSLDDGNSQRVRGLKREKAFSIVKYS